MPEEPVPPADDHEDLIIFRVSRLGLTERCVPGSVVSVCATYTTGWRAYTHYTHVDGPWGRECLGGEGATGHVLSAVRRDGARGEACNESG